MHGQARDRGVAGCSLCLWVCHQRSYVTLRPGQSASNLQQLYGQLHRRDGLPRKPCPLAAHLGRHAAGQHRHPSLLLTSTIPRVCCSRPLSLSSFSHRIASRTIPFPFLLPPPSCMSGKGHEGWQDGTQSLWIFYQSRVGFKAWSASQQSAGSDSWLQAATLDLKAMRPIPQS